jgi:hypothetical protein
MGANMLAELIVAYVALCTIYVCLLGMLVIIAGVSLGIWAIIRDLLKD